MLKMPLNPLISIKKGFERSVNVMLICVNKTHFINNIFI